MALDINLGLNKVAGVANSVEGNSITYTIMVNNPSAQAVTNIGETFSGTITEHTTAELQDCLCGLEF